MTTTETTRWTEQAKQVERFVTRFGKASYRLLADYAALPLVLTPELVHYLRVEFLRDAGVPWEAEVDLLLSDLCSQVGHELYTMDTQVRAYLLDQMQDDPVWQQRQREVAQVLISYVSYLSRIDPKRRQKELEAQRLAAMTYLGDEQCQQAAQEIANRFKQLEQAGSERGSEHSIRAELARFARITQELALQLRQKQNLGLVEFAEVVQQLLRNPEAVTATAVERAYQVGDYELVASSLPIRLPTRAQETVIEGFPPLKTLTFETGRFSEQAEAEAEGPEFPPLEPQTVEVVELYFEDEPDADASETAEAETGLSLRQFTFEVATIARDEGGEWEITRESGTGRRYEEPLGNELTLEMVAIPAGNFMMGSPEDEPERYDREGPQHDVSVQGFYMGRYPVTQAQWRFVAELPQVERELNPDPSNFKGADRPVERVSWLDAVEFCQRLTRFTGQVYRLPTEAEWEYACRAETTTPFHFGDTIAPELANYSCSVAYNDGPKGDHIGETTPVGQFRVANAFGLGDMHGNVYEWCQDHYHGSYEGAPRDGSAWIDPEAEENKSRILRGGSWLYHPRHCRSANRYNYYPRVASFTVGFRIVCSAPRALQ